MDKCLLELTYVSAVEIGFNLCLSIQRLIPRATLFINSSYLVITSSFDISKLGIKVNWLFLAIIVLTNIIRYRYCRKTKSFKNG